MATNIPPHNLTEVVNATIELVKNPKAGLIEVLKHVQGPDFPTGGFLYGKSGIVNAYKTGRGRFMMRAKVATENLTKEKQAIIVTEIPYQVNKSKLIERIAELVNEKIIDDISDVRDESDRDGMRIVIELKRGAQPEIVLNQLYKHTQMQESFSMIFLAVLNGQPRELGARRGHSRLHRSPHRRGAAPHRLPAAQGPRARTHPRRLQDRPRQSRHGHQDHSRIRLRAPRPAKTCTPGARELRSSSISIASAWPRRTRPHAQPGRCHSRIAALSPDAALGRRNSERTQQKFATKIAEYESILASDKKLRNVIVKELEEGPRPVRRRAPHADRRRVRRAAA